MSKYHARKVEVDGFRFDSKAEAKRYTELRLLERAGEIRDLTLQPKFRVGVGDNLSVVADFMEERKLVFTYYADFMYITREGIEVIEDVKGYKTPVYRLKKKVVEAVYGVTITEITK